MWRHIKYLALHHLEWCTLHNHHYHYHHDSPKVVHLWNMCLFQIEDFQRLVDDEHLVLPTDKPVWIGVRHSQEAGYRYPDYLDWKKIIAIISTRFQYNQMDASAMIKLEGERAEGMQCAGYK